MIPSFLRFLHKNPWWNIPIVIAFYLLVVLPHEVVGRFVAWVFDGRFTRDDYNLIILAASLVGLAAYVYFLAKKTSSDGWLRKHIFLYLLATVFFSVLCFKLLIVINIEVVHFVQYAAVAILLFPLVKRYGETVFWCTLLGAADEAWQYFYLAPQRTNYYDFNDVIINLLGSVYGLLLVRAAQPVFALPPRWQFWRSPAFFAALALAVFVALAFQLGWITLYAPPDGQGALWSLIRVPQEGFWTIVHPNVKFHVVQPVEGLVIVALLLALYTGIGKGTVSVSRT